MLEPWQRPEVITHCRLLADSYLHWMQQPLLSDSHSDARLAQALYEAPFVLLSHGTEADPVFNYANQRAQALWKLSWAQFTQLPSRKSAEPVEESRRKEFMAHAKQRGVIQDYQGIRISSEGQRFYIIDVILWNVIDAAGKYHGQAAKFDQWKFVE